MQVCQDLQNQYEAEGASSLDHIITGDKMWYHLYVPESKQQSMETGKGDPSGFPETQTNHQLQPAHHHTDEAEGLNFQS